MISRQNILGACARFLILFLLFCLLAPGQNQSKPRKKKTNPKILELEKKLPNLSKKEKLEALLSLARYYSFSSLNKSFKNAGQATRLAVQLKDLKGEATALNIISGVYSDLGKPGQALEKAGKSLAISEELGDKKGMVKVFMTFGYIYLSKDNYYKALDYYTRAMDLSKKVGDKLRTAACLGNIGVIHKYLGNSDKDLEAQLEALEIRKELGHPEKIAISYSNIGAAYVSQKNKRAAMKYFEMANTIFSKTGNKSGIADNLDIMGRISSKKEPVKALEYFNRALEINKEVGGIRKIIASTVQLANFYRKIKKYNEAVEYATMALKSAEEQGTRKDAASALECLGRAYMDLKQYDRALPLFKKNLDTALDHDEKVGIMRNCFFISQLLDAKGDCKNALDYLQKYVKLRDDSSKEKIKERVAEIQARYDVSESVKKTEELLEEIKLRDLELEDRTLLLYAAIIISFLLLIIFFQFFRRYRFFFTFWKKKNYIGHYHLEEKNGSGGMGDIYKVRDLHKNSASPSCALKLLREEYYKDDKYKARFKSEAAIIDQLNHPNIVKVMERGEYQGTLYIAMELLQGETLADLLENRTGSHVPLPGAVSMMRQMAAALVEIHKRGIIHRDLKPENIMVVSSEQEEPLIKILDFGLARTRNLTRLTRTGVIMGTIFYVAPEQLARSSVVPAGDIYSLGVIFYQVLAGEKPFCGDTAFHVARRILKEDPPDLEAVRPGLPAGLTALVKQMMDKQPGQRPTAEEVLHALKDLGASISAYTHL